MAAFAGLITAMCPLVPSMTCFQEQPVCAGLNGMMEGFSRRRLSIVVNETQTEVNQPKSEVNQPQSEVDDTKSTGDGHGADAAQSVAILTAMCKDVKIDECTSSAIRVVTAVSSWAAIFALALMA